MKSILLFIVGAVVGVFVCFAIFYASGLVLESQGILLYESEADQQRNFNIFIFLSLIISIGSGCLFVKKYA